MLIYRAEYNIRKYVHLSYIYKSPSYNSSMYLIFHPLTGAKSKTMFSEIGIDFSPYPLQRRQVTTATLTFKSSKIYKVETANNLEELELYMLAQ